jgi:hypothetical protein
MIGQLCRARHNRLYAEYRIMPSVLGPPVNPMATWAVRLGIIRVRAFNGSWFQSRPTTHQIPASLGAGLQKSGKPRLLCLRVASVLCGKGQISQGRHCWSKADVLVFTRHNPALGIRPVKRRSGKRAPTAGADYSPQVGLCPVIGEFTSYLRALRLTLTGREPCGIGPETPWPCKGVRRRFVPEDR